MEIFRQNALRHARREVATWFATTAGGSALLDGKGGVFRLDATEARTLRDDAEAAVFLLYERLQYRALGAAASLFAIQMFASLFPAMIEEIVSKSALLIYSGHGIWLFHEAWKSAQEQKLYRAALANRLAGRPPIPAEFAGELGFSDPVRKVLIAVFVLLFAGNIAAELLAHAGIDVFERLPPWIWVPVIVFTLVLALGNLWIDRSRGIGVMPPADMSSRVQNRLDRLREDGT